MFENILSKKRIYIFTILFFSITFSFSQNNGPKAPEAGSFEPVDATDMVSLLTGDVNYVLPLLEVPSPEGSYPIVLAYHGGIAYDQESTWVGLGWNLNTGVINRSINGYPDDWNGGLVRDRTYYMFKSESIQISLGVGKKVVVEAGIGYSWDSNGSQSGSVSMSISNTETGVGVNVGVGYSNTDGWSASAGASLQKGNVGFGVNADTNGNAGVSIGYGKGGNSMGVSFGTSGLSVSANVSGVGTASYSSNNSTSADVTTLSVGLKIPLAPKTFLKLGYTKVKYEKDETYFNRVWGPLHYNKLNSDPRYADDITYGSVVGTEHNRDFYMDTYDQPLPQTEKEIIDFDDTFEKYQHSFTNPAYDSYVVNAQGLSGSMKPRLLENAYLIGKGYKNEYDTEDGDPINNPLDVLNQIAQNTIEDNNPELLAYAISQNGGIESFINNILPWNGGVKSYWKNSAVVNHHFNLSKKFDKQFGNGFNDIHFYFDHQLHSNLIINENTINTNAPSNANNINQFFNGAHINRIGRVENSNYIETFTNSEINTLLSSNGYFFESKNFDRSSQFGSKSTGIGGYRITSSDGKTYHYSQPVYQYEEFYRQLTPRNDGENQGTYSEDDFYHEQRRMESYATHWLLTAITGPDYVKLSNSNIKYPSQNDYGYWIRFDYGNWTEGYTWRLPKKQDTYNNLTHDKTKRSDEYSWGRKQLIYLNKVVTRTHTALFVKSIKNDGESTQIGGPNYKDFPSITSGSNKENDNYVYYVPQKSLKLDEIILVKSEFDNILLNNQYGNLINSPNTSRTVNWTSMADISYEVNNQNNILDIFDLEVNPTTGKYSIYENAIKIIKLNQNYDLAKDQANGGLGRLTLNSVESLGRNATEYMPPYTFDYIGKNVNYEYCDDYENCDKDAWGYNKNDVSIWSMNSIKTPVGAEIKIEYEEDDYYTEAFARRFWTQGLTFKIESYNTTQYKITVGKNTNYDPVNNYDFRDYFDEGEKVGLDLWIAVRKSYINVVTCHRKGIAFDLNPNKLEGNEFPIITNASQDYIELLVDKIVNYGNLLFNPPNTSWNYGDYITGRTFCQNTNCSSTNAYDDKERGEFPIWNGCNSYRHSMYFGLIANKTPVADSGGGIRAKSIATYSTTGDFSKVEYSYNHPTKNRSSGITSYAPVRGYKYIAYQAELPGPKVNYEYVTVTQKGSNGTSLGSTRYQFDVLKPAVDIFSKNLTIGNHFKSEVTESDLPQSTKGADVKLYDNTAMIGSLLIVDEFNSEGHLMKQKKNNYKAFDQLGATNRGSLQESFLSMKSIYDFRARYVKLPFDYGFESPDGSFGISVNFTKNLYLQSASTLTLKKRFANVSTKITYPVIQESSITISDGFKTEIEFSNPDSKTGEYLTTQTTLSDGTSIKTDKIPAYTKYPQMGSKVDNINNKNMLTQEAMNVTSYGSSNKTLNANITTWNDTWSYRNNIGNESNSTNEVPVWRKHKTFVWKDNINSFNGSYSTDVNETNDYFNWGTGTPTNTKWQNVSEITRYTHWSSPIETRDINNNFASSKMADNFSKVIAGGNARYSEMYYSGAEYIAEGNIFEGEVRGALYQTDEVSHTGDFAVKTNAANDVVFNVAGQIGTDYNDLSKDFRPGKYKVSFWAHQQNGTDSGTKLGSNNGAIITKAETVSAGCWKQFNYYVDLQPNTSFLLYVTNTLGGGYFYDDFRMHPVYASMNSYVYDQNTDELLYILDGNNMATSFRYDDAGRLKSSYNEVEDTSEFDGGFKIVSQYKYHYKGINSSTNYNEDINNCIDQTYKPLTLKGLVRDCTPEFNPYDINYKMYVSNGSGNYKYEWQWLTDASTGQYSNWIEGNENQFIPYAIKYCTSESFNKIWNINARVTDLVTEEVVTANDEYSTNGCNGYINNSKVLLGVEASQCHNTCGSSKYQFHLYPLDGNLTLPQTIAYIDNNSGISTPMDLNQGDGLFCPVIKYVETNECDSGYIEFISITPTHENSSGFTYEFYLNCVTNTQLSINPQLKNGVANDPKYAKAGILIKKDGDGKIISITDINAKKGK